MTRRWPFKINTAKRRYIVTLVLTVLFDACLVVIGTSYRHDYGWPFYGMPRNRWDIYLMNGAIMYEYRGTGHPSHYSMYDRPWHGFVVRIGDIPGMPGARDSVGIAIPLWTLALLLGIDPARSIAQSMRERLKRERQVRGFEPIMKSAQAEPSPAEITPPPPTAHTAKSTSSAPHD